MDIQIGNAYDENSRLHYHVVLVKNGLRVISLNEATGLPNESRCFNLSFAQIGQMEYGHGVLRLQTSQGNFCFRFPDAPPEEIQQFVDAVQQALEADGEIEWVET